MVPARVQQLVSTPEREVEIVEHEGIGHPDTICDALAERLSVALAELYLERNVNACAYAERGPSGSFVTEA